jgi:two-component system NtrC family sensor kinase
MKSSYPSARNKTGSGRRDNGSSEQDFAGGSNIFQILAENSSELLAHVRLLPEFRMVYINAPVYRVTGYTREEFYENPDLIFQCIHPDDAGRMKSLLDPDTPNLPNPTVLRGRKKDGTEVWIELTRTVVRDASAGTADAYLFCRDITRRQRTLEALKESQGFISSLLENAPHATIVINPDTSIRYVNPAWEEINGWRLDEIIGLKTPYPWWPEEQKEEFSKNFQLAMERGSGKGEVVAVKRSGERYWIAMNWTSIYKDGEMQYMLINSIDITERRRAEEQVRQLSSVTEQISEATIVTDPDFKIKYLNRAAQRLFGYSLEEALGKRLGLFNERPIPRAARRKILDIVNSGRVWSGLATKRRKDGSTLLCDCLLSPLYDEDGRIISYIDVERDVTEKNEMELKLQEHKRLIESILASLPEGVLVTDGQDRIVLANEAFHRIFRLSKKTVKARPFQELIRMDGLHELYRSVRRGTAGRNTFEIRRRVRGRDKIIACNIVKMDAERTLLIFSDVSQEREDNEKLYLTDRLASIGEMAAGLAHELNNPLTAILTLSQLLLHHGLPGESQEDMRCIYEEAQRATRIVKNVLLFARNNNYENGRSSANDVVRDVLRLRQHDERAVQIDVVTHLAEDMPEVSIDRFQLQQVFLNIILNAEAAIKETGRRGTLTVTTEEADDRVKIHFTDTGCGIKKSVVPRIFDPFFTTKDIGKGTGLGLSICYGIVVKHGGRITVRSRPGEGSTFTVEIPAAQS